ncbi:hypothetical protein CA13_41290 [Planctomycetes bacterium CA13]|uniref:Urease accessory protein UreH-like transmembrane domain-containing protein n=1 Tax=Novipirellula herctigrandis TaxID=2527986 RepID=A0A5C5Z6F0_9BACT|nr:hypothetical protein CA13_41290 [Planctomycetes bacterium CA13]
MFTLGMAVFVASLIGSLHCIGMCGPLALWVTGGGASRATITSYHLGRLATYMIAAVAAGILGAAVSFGGDMVGFQSAAAKVAGILLVLVGLYRLALLHPRLSGFVTPSSGPSTVASVLQKAKPLIERRGANGKAFLGGLITTWLPCGWLYLFVLVAAGTGSVVTAMVVMFAFWIGTLPALTTMLVGIQSLTPKLRSALPIATSLLLIVTGLYTVTGRAAVDVSTLVSPKLAEEITPTSLIDLTDEPLPCCAAEGADDVDSESLSKEEPPCPLCVQKLEDEISTAGDIVAEVESAE